MNNFLNGFFNDKNNFSWTNKIFFYWFKTCLFRDFLKIISYCNLEEIVKVRLIQHSYIISKVLKKV
jgi:hypothetical protein